MALPGASMNLCIRALRLPSALRAQGRLIGCPVQNFLRNLRSWSHLDQPRREVDRHRGAVFHGPGEIVDVDVAAEDVLGLAVVERDWGAGEGDQRGVRRCRA